MGTHFWFRSELPNNCDSACSDLEDVFEYIKCARLNYNSSTGCRIKVFDLFEVRDIEPSSSINTPATFLWQIPTGSPPEDLLYITKIEIEYPEEGVNCYSSLEFYSLNSANSTEFVGDPGILYESSKGAFLPARQMPMPSYLVIGSRNFCEEYSINRFIIRSQWFDPTPSGVESSLLPNIVASLFFLALLWRV